MGSDLLLEIGVEDLPAAWVSRAVTALPGVLRGELDRLRVSFSAIRAHGSSRRLVAIATGLAQLRPALDTEVVGPPAPVAYDAQGQPTGAAQRFADRVGVSLAQLYVVEGARGAHVAARQLDLGGATAHALPSALVATCEAVLQPPGPPWATGESKLSHLRWLLALFGDGPLEFEVGRVVSAPRTYFGAFGLAPSVGVSNAEEYFQLLQQQGVVLNVQQRRQLLSGELQRATRAQGVEPVLDQKLLDEYSWSLEAPRAVAARLGSDFAALPVAVADVLLQEQRCFRTQDAVGTRQPCYLIAVNRDEAAERVVADSEDSLARQFRSARQHYEADRRRSFDDLQKDLAGVTFHPRLGSFADKVARIAVLVAALARASGLSEAEVRYAVEAAALSKCDLASSLVRQVPALRGKLGRALAIERGIAEPIAAAVDEHHAPRDVAEAPAEQPLGALLAVADRLDTLVGCAAIKIMPMGAADEFGLRDLAITLLRTLIHHALPLQLGPCVRLAYAGYAGALLDASEDEVAHRLRGFFDHRLRGVLGQSYPPAVVQAAIAASNGSPHDAAQRAAALMAVASTPG